MSRSQPSIRSFFQPRQPEYAAPPSRTPPTAQNGTKATATAATTLPPYGVVGGPTAPPPRPSSIHPQASIVPVAERHIAALRRINSLLLPVTYPDSFYRCVLDPAVSGLFSRAILWADPAEPTTEPKVIGGVVCRLEPSPFVSAAATSSSLGPVSPASAHAIYIRSLALLSPYRSLGLAAAALEDILANAAALSASPGSGLNICTVYAHVWTENEDGLRWYASRGFAKEGGQAVSGYYFKLRPDTAWIVRRDVSSSSSSPAPPSAQTPPARQPSSSFPTSAPLQPVPSSTTAAAVNLPSLAAAAQPGPTPPPPMSTSKSPSPAPSSRSQQSLSFQNARPETEWNDLPVDMMAAGRSSRSSNNNSNNNLLSPPPQGGSAPGSGASSRSSSTARKKKDRAYPSAAFGS